MAGPGLFEKAVELHGAGRLAEAEALCRQVLAAEPGRPEPLLLAGVIRLQSGDPNGALPLIRRSLGIAPGQPLGHFWHAVALAQTGQTAEAVRVYERAAELHPAFVEAHYNRGQLLLATNRPAEALAAFERTLALQPGLAEAQCLRAASLARLGRNDEALALLDAILAANANFTSALNLRSEVHGQSGRFAAALADSDRSLAIDPNQLAPHVGRGNALFALGRLNEAEQAFDRVLAVDANAVPALMMRGIIHGEFRRFAQSLADLERAAALAPGDAAIQTNIGNTLRMMEKNQEAAAAFDRAIALDPRFAKAHYGRAIVWHKVGELERAMADCTHALALDPSLGIAATERFHVASLLCDWRDRAAMIDDLARRIRREEVLFPWLVITAVDDPELQFLAGRRVSEPATPSSVPARATAHDRLRVAYLSPDFHDHPVAYQLVELFERHDASRIEMWGICLLDAPESAIRSRVAHAFEHFEKVGSRSDAEIAEFVRAREIDIAVDLAGHTEGSRQRIFSFRPAPIAVNYAGHPGTIGSEHIDYVLADDVVIPPETERFFAEKVVRLPDCFFPADTTGPRLEAPSRAEAGLPEAGFVFCAFNNTYKLSPQTFDVWMRLLRAVDGSVLWLSVGNQTARGNLRAEARSRGIASERLVFSERAAERERHLARLKLADLYLDTVPYNAHSTASDMLWAGVPVVSLMGRSFAARVASSLLTTMGLEELIARNFEQYERLALELAHSPARMAAVRARLTANRDSGPPFDMARLARQIETAYETMWKIHSEGAKPRGFTVPRS